MAETQSILISLICFVVLALNNYSVVNSNGLAVRMIHPDSEESPFFQPNLTHETRIKRSIYQSIMREKYLTNLGSSLVVQPEMDVQSFFYIVKIGMGTFKSNPSYKEYYLDMDTSSRLLWSQCDGCAKCFKQISKPFPRRNSSTFHPILNGGKPLGYELEYADGSSTSGIVAEETFYFKSNTGSITKIEKLQFGCGLYNNMQYGNYKNNKISGVMGLGWGNLSFLNQISLQSNGKFSYCLPTASKKIPKMYLRFGNGIVKSQNSRTTPLYMVNRKTFYYVEMQGISINEKRLNISPKVFELKNDGRLGGCVFDTGTTFSRIISPAFDILKSELEKHFSRLKKTKGNLELCYERNKPEGYNNLPEITFHFQGSGADFVMKPESVFEVKSVGGSLFRRSRENFCLTILRSNVISIIGSYQQTNQRIIYDTKNKQLFFNGDDCYKNQ